MFNGRPLTIFIALVATACSWANRKVLLVPLDDRPATGQFAQMIGDIAGYQVDLPPSELLGRFKDPGNPDKIIDWLDSLPTDAYDAVILSTDMALYGGLIASREYKTDLASSLARLDRIAAWRKSRPSMRLYGFSSIMRLTPTSVQDNANYRELLTKFVLARTRLANTFSIQNVMSFFALRERIPSNALNDYDQARARDFTIQKQLLNATNTGVFDMLMLGQDDARSEGPQIHERDSLKEIAANLKVGTRATFCEGIDQLSNMLLSRLVTDETGWKPLVRIVVSDPLGLQMVPPYEASPIGASLREQISASGAIPADPNGPFDYTLYVNTPNPRPGQFEQFLQNLGTEIEQGFPVAVADINLGKSGIADPTLFDTLSQNSRATRLLSYAGWNTAGNTLGTAIPAANIYLCARRLPEVDPLQREVSQKTFLLHRLINDFAYHRFTRPRAFAMIDQFKIPRDEVYGEPFNETDSFVRADLSDRLRNMFQLNFAGQKFFAGPKQYVLDDVDRVDVRLPWPRAYEVKIDFRLRTREVPAQ